MAHYIKKPVVIEAVHCSTAHWAAGNDWSALPKWMADAYERGEVIFANHPSRIEIRTLEGLMTAGITDMIIKGVKGELYPCKPDIFAATYNNYDDYVDLAPHYHENAGDGTDACGRCGLDLRDQTHIRLSQGDRSDEPESTASSMKSQTTPEGS